MLRYACIALQAGRTSASYAKGALASGEEALNLGSLNDPPMAEN